MMLEKLGKYFHIQKDSVFVGKHPKWVGVHVDTPWCEDAKDYGCPARIYVHLHELGCVTVTLPTKYHMDLDRQSKTATMRTEWTWPKDRQWHPRWGNWELGGKLRRITFRPNRWLQCQKVIATRTGRRGQELKSICGAFRWHRGICAGSIPVTWFETTPLYPRGNVRMAWKSVDGLPSS